MLQGRLHQTPGVTTTTTTTTTKLTSLSLSSSSLCLWLWLFSRLWFWWRSWLLLWPWYVVVVVVFLVVVFVVLPTELRLLLCAGELAGAPWQRRLGGARAASARLRDLRALRSGMLRRTVQEGLWLWAKDHGCSCVVWV